MKNRKRLIGLLIFVVALMVASIPKAEPKTVVVKQDVISCGTAEKPCFIKSIPAESPPNEIKKEKEKGSYDWWIVYLTVGLVAVGLAQVFLFWWQLSLIRASLNDAKVAADAAKLGAEAAKESADAMRSVATIIDNNGRKQMRAYLSFITGNCFPQDREKGNKYQIRIFVKNTGFTPAHAVHVRFKTKIFPYPLPEDADLSLPNRPISEEAGYIAAAQQSYYTAWLDEIIDDETIKEIKTLNGKGLYVYGNVQYKDVWGNAWYTNFLHLSLWDRADIYNTLNMSRHNDAI
jgi:hypothetical protein